MSAHDVIVVGLGGMGSAAAYSLAREGARVLGLDRYRPPHDLGSTHGSSRVIREAYFEHPQYVPLIRRAYGAWHRLEEVCGRRLLVETGGLMLGPRDGVLVDGSLASALAHDLPYEELTAAEVRRRFPVFHPPPELIGIFEPRAGVLFPECSVEVLLAAAAGHGADLRFGEPVLGWQPSGDGVRVRTAGGEHRAGHLVLAAGPWTAELLGGADLGLEVERTVQHWFRPRARPEAFLAASCPVFIWEYDDGRMWYGLPDAGDGLKVALHYQGEITTAETARREVDPDEVAGLRTLLERFMPDAAGEHLRSAICLYTNTPDLHFVIDRHPETDAAWIVSACSGHGFKFAPAIGDLLAERIVGGDESFDLRAFRRARLDRG